MPENIGQHLLGWTKTDPDPRNYALSTFLSEDDLDKALAEVLKSWEGKKTKNFCNAVTKHIRALEGSVTPTPPPTPPTVESWRDDDDPILDQQDTPHCVGFSGAAWLNLLPIDDHVQNDMGHDLYSACKVVDHEPGQENGSTIASLAKVLKNRFLLTTYAFAETIEDVKTFVQTSGPVIWGMGWTDSMFNPTSAGLIVPSGDDVGGHAVTEYEYNPVDDLHWFTNSWSDAWGLAGMFCMTSEALAERLANGAEAMAAVEIPKISSIPR